MVAFELEFILNDKNDKNRTRDADRKPGDVDKGVSLLPSHIAQSDLQKVFKHGPSFLNVVSPGNTF
jgi:hypothetical protein